MTTTQEYIEAVSEVFVDLMLHSDGSDEVAELIAIGIERVERMKHLRAVCDGCGKGVDSPAECIEGDKPITYWCEDCLIPMLERRGDE